MRRPKLLDLFCGAGGCSVGFDRAGFDVTGVDDKPHPDYPFPMVVADAMVVLEDIDFLEGFDVIAASPPCPRYSTITPDASREKHPDLIPVVRHWLKAWAEYSGGLYIIENVPGAARVMENPVRVCGSAFGLLVRRHRFFESNAWLVPTECFHDRQGRPIGVYGDHPQDDEHYRRPDGTRRGNKAKSIWQAQVALGIDWMTDWDDRRDSAGVYGVLGDAAARACRERGRRMNRRLDRWLTAADVLCAVRDAVAERLRGARCPTCWARTRNLPAHIAIDHAEV